MSAGVVVLCGGGSSRFGSDKTAAQLDGTTILDRILLDLPDEWPVVCVGIPRDTTRPVRWAREDPPLGGPVAGIEAGLTALDNDVVVVLAGDQPFSGGHAAELVGSLTEHPDAEGVVGSGQLLLGAYRRGPLSRVTTHQAHASVRSTLGMLRVVSVDLPPDEVMDVDTPADLERAQAHARSATGRGRWR